MARAEVAEVTEVAEVAMAAGNMYQNLAGNDQIGRHTGCSEYMRGSPSRSSVRTTCKCGHTIDACCRSKRARAAVATAVATVASS